MDAFPHPELFLSWCEKMSLRANEEHGADEFLAKFRLILSTGDDVSKVVDELTDIISRSTPVGCVVLGTLCHEFPAQSQLLRTAINFFLYLLQNDDNAPVEAYTRGLSALKHALISVRDPSSFAELLFFFSKFSPTSKQKTAILHQAREHLSRALTAHPKSSSTNRRRAFLAYTLLDLGLESDFENIDEIQYAYQIVSNIPEVNRFSFLELVEGQICLALADHFENSESLTYAQRAVTCFSKALEITPNDHDASLGIINTLILMADQSPGNQALSILDKAEGYASSFTKHFSSSASGQTALGNISSIRANFSEGERRLGLIQRAGKYFEKALLMDGDDINALQGLGNVAIAMAERPLLSNWSDQIRVGESAFKRALELKPSDFNALYGLSTIYRFKMRSSDFDQDECLEKALSLLKTCTDRHPDRISGHIATGQTLRESVVFGIIADARAPKKLNEAMTAYQIAKKLSPRDTYTKISILNLKIDRLAEIYENTEIFIQAQILADELIQFYKENDSSRTAIHSIVTLLGKVDNQLNRIGEPFPADLVKQYSPVIRQMIGEAGEEYEHADLAGFEFGAKNEYLTALEAYADLQAKDLRKAALTLAYGVGKYFRDRLAFDTKPQLPNAAAGTANVYLSLTTRGAYSIVDCNGDLTVVPLPGISRQLLVSELGSLDRATAREKHAASDQKRYSGGDPNSAQLDVPGEWNSAVYTLLVWLGEALSPLLDFLENQSISNINWIPQGLWGLCPLHAMVRQNGKAIFETYECRYLFPLFQSQRKVSLTKSKSSITAFVNPVYEAQSTLSSGPIEVNFFNSLKSSAVLYPGQKATAENFLRLPSNQLDNSVLHLSCHGSGAQNDPRACRLFFSNDTVVELTELLEHPKFGSCQLVFLSACESGLRSRYVIDDAVSLASGFLALGANNAISSLWIVSDFLSLEFIRKFYSHFSETQCVSFSFTQASSELKSQYGKSAAHVWGGYQLWHNS